MKKSVSAAGMARSMTRWMKCPSMRRLLGSIARKNAGIPMLNIDTSEICDGVSGYLIILTIVKIESKNEKMFFTKNSVAERSMLLMTRRPSETIWGIWEKSESSNATCAA